MPFANRPDPPKPYDTLEVVELVQRARTQALDEAITAVDDLYASAPSADFAEAIRMAVLEIEAIRDRATPRSADHE